MTDETTLVMPDGWRRVLHPRRDRPDVPKPPAPGRGASKRVRALVDEVRDDVEVILALPDTAPDIAEAARAHLRGEPDPLGAAAVALVTVPLHAPRAYKSPGRLFTDAWVADHGIAFAARAFTEWGGIWAERPERMGVTGLPLYGGRASSDEARAMAVRHRGPGETRTHWWLERKNARTLRARLAAAPDDVYAETVEGLAGGRRHDLQRIIAAYLAPTRDDWVEELPALAGGDLSFEETRMLLCALGRPHQLTRLDLGLFADHVDVVATLADTLGPGPVVPQIVDELDREGFDSKGRRLVDHLTVLPVDEAFQALIDRIDWIGRHRPDWAERPEMAPAVLAAARRFPARAMRLLACSDVPRAAELLSVHVRTHPEIAESVSPDLPADRQEAIRTILDRDVRLPQAVDVPPLPAEPPWTRPGARPAPAAAIEAPATGDPLDDLPGKIPDVGWASPRVLPQILLRDRAEALPDEATGQFLTMPAMSELGAPYAGVAVVRELCDPASLAEFGWALFRWWEMCGLDATQKWAFTQLALIGDDGTVRRLAPVIRAWPGKNRYVMAVTGLDVLAAIGTGTALMHLHSVSQRVRSTGLKDRAREKIEDLAVDLGLTAEQLADRLVPDFGLDASGTLTLDYGPRRFVIGFDELLRPTVADEDGKVRKSLPKPGAKDDPDLAPAAYKRFATLKKDVRTVASDQLTRLETAMLTGRRRSRGEFREFLVAHPLAGHLVRRLVWLAEAEDGTAVSFRVAEDGTFADAADDAVTLPETARIGIAHPLHLGEEVKAWTELFTDYEILQPFEQLARPVHTLTDEERATGRLARFEGVEVAVGGLLGLVGRGWERGTPMAGTERDFGYAGPGCAVAIDLDPGIAANARYDSGDQILCKVRMTDGPGSTHGLDPVTVSEVLAGLVRLTAPEQETNR